MHRKKLSSFFIALIIVAILVVVGFVLPKLVLVPRYDLDTLSDSAAVGENIAQTLNLQIDLGDGSGILKFNDVEINNNENLFNVMQRVTEQNDIEFSYKDFGGDLGIFIESINNSAEQKSKTKWWQYWINNEYAQVGISGYKVKHGDEVIFKFTDDQLEIE